MDRIEIPISNNGVINILKSLIIFFCIKFVTDGKRLMACVRDDNLKIIDLTMNRISKTFK